MSDALFEEFRATLTPEHLCHYPVLSNLYAKIADLVGVSAENIYLGTGSGLAIKALLDSCMNKDDHMILHRPAYFMFGNYAHYAGADVTFVPVDVRQP